MISSINRHTEQDNEGEDEFRQSLDLCRRVDWWVFTCDVGSRKVISYSRDNICPIRCNAFTVYALVARKAR